jgi:hypothetical protein
MQYINIAYIAMWCLVLYLNFNMLFRNPERKWKIAGIAFICLAIFFIVFDILNLFELV